MEAQDWLDTPLGPLRINANEVGVTAIEFDLDAALIRRENSITLAAKEQLRAYFGAELTAFNLPLQASGTEFQHRVWDALCQIPHGEVCSYQDVANQLNQPTATRAVGAANGKNPIAIVVPCHRVIGKSGTLTGYAGGLDRKAWLLQHEQPEFNLISQ